ncbi:MAG: peptidyl-tRNA hydrolase, partial [Chloroflexia bacterium]|nr:peptidyl-tRNA hydrolase [Chloroflexia bacterium]
MPWIDRAARAEFLIVGLGNPGQQYARTRHNVGFRCVRLLAKQAGLAFDKKKSRSRLAEGEIGGRHVVLACPYTYMNRSGRAVAGLQHWLRLPPESLLVVYDDLDLPLG